MYQCFHCMKNSVVWGCDYGFDECGYDGEGIVHVCHCANCGAEIEYRISMQQEEVQEDKNKMTIYDFIEEGEKNENKPSSDE